MTKIKTALDGKIWLQYSISVWNDVKKSSEENGYGHPAVFPIELARRLIEVYTHEGDLVLDPFLGTGTTLVAAQQLGRRGLGFEIYDTFVDIARKRLSQYELFEDARQEIVQASAHEVLKHLASGSVHLTVTSPPYWDILTQRRTADYKAIRNYGMSEDDFGLIETYEEFREALQRVFSQVFTATVVGGRCCVVIMDLRKKDEFFPLHMDVTLDMKSMGWTLEDMIIWDRRSDYNNLRPLGYPYVFRVNRIHEYVMIYQKRRAIEPPR